MQWRFFYVSTDGDKYRLFAEFCEKMFRKTQTMDMKKSWLRLALKWRSLIPDETRDLRAEPVRHDGQPRKTHN